MCQSVKDIYQGLDKADANNRLKTIVERYKNKASKFCDWLQEHFIEGLTYYDFPSEHWRKIRTTNGVERMNQEQKRRTRVARLFPSISSYERLVITIAMRIHEEWVFGNKYMAM